MIKQILITSIAAAGLLLSAQATAHSSGGSVTVWKNSANSHGHSHKHSVKPVRRPAPKPKYRVNKEQRQQATMIQQGIKTCQITPREAAKLNARQAKIKKAERRMRANGLQHWERMNLKKRLHNARVQINRLTKNGKKCGRRSKKSRRGYNHSHGSTHHKHSNGNHFHSHKSWSTSNGHNSFSISIGH